MNIKNTAFSVETTEATMRLLNTNEKENMAKIKYMLMLPFVKDFYTNPRFFDTHAQAHHAMTYGINQALADCDIEEREDIREGIDYVIGENSAWAQLPRCEMTYRIFRLSVAGDGDIKVAG